MVGTCQPWIGSQESRKVNKWSHLWVAKLPLGKADLEMGHLQGKFVCIWAEEVRDILLWDDEESKWPRVMLMHTWAMHNAATNCSMHHFRHPSVIIMSAGRPLAVSKCGSCEDNDTMAKLRVKNLNKTISRAMRAFERDGLDSGLVADTDNTWTWEEEEGRPWVQGLPQLYSEWVHETLVQGINHVTNQLNRKGDILVLTYFIWFLTFPEYKISSFASQWTFISSSWPFTSF